MVEVKRKSFRERAESLKERFGFNFILFGEAADVIVSHVAVAVAEIKTLRSDVMSSLLGVSNRIAEFDRKTSTSLETLGPAFASISEKLALLSTEVGSAKEGDNKAAKSLDELKKSVDEIIRLLGNDGNKDIHTKLVGLGQISEQITKKVEELLFHFSDAETASIPKLIMVLTGTLELVGDIKNELSTNASDTKQLLAIATRLEAKIGGISAETRDEVERPDGKLADIIRELKDEAEKTKAISASVATIEARLPTTEQRVQELRDAVAAAFTEEMPGLRQAIRSEIRAAITTGLALPFASFQGLVEGRLDGIRLMLDELLGGKKEADNKTSAIKSDGTEAGPFDDHVAPIKSTPPLQIVRPPESNSQDTSLIDRLKARKKIIVKNLKIIMPSNLTLETCRSNLNLIDATITEIRELLDDISTNNTTRIIKIPETLDTLKRAFSSIHTKLESLDSATSEAEKNDISGIKARAKELIEKIDSYLATVGYLPAQT